MLEQLRGSFDAMQPPQGKAIAYSTTVIIRADEVVRRRGYSDHSVTMCVCVWVCYHDKTKVPDRNDLKLGIIIVVLDVCRGLWILSSKVKSQGHRIASLRIVELSPNLQ